MNKPEIAKAMTLSSNHIDMDTADMLDNYIALFAEGKMPEFPLTIIDKEGYGWIICVTGTDDIIDNLPKPLADCLKYAKNYGCDWLTIESDGPIIDDLPTYPWI